MVDTGYPLDTADAVSFDQQPKDRFSLSHRQVHAVQGVFAGFGKPLVALLAGVPLFSPAVLSVTLTFDPAVVARHREISC